MSEPEIMQSPNLTPVVPIPAKQPSEAQAPVVTFQPEKADATNAEIFAEATGKPGIDPGALFTPSKNPAFPLARPGGTGAGAPTKPPILEGPIVKAPGASATVQGIGPALVSRQARKPVDPSTAKSKALSVSSKPNQESASEDQGVWFIKNRFNENVQLPDGRLFKFKKSLEQVVDPAIIKGLRAVAKKYDIFEDQPATPIPTETTST